MSLNLHAIVSYLSLHSSQPGDANGDVWDDFASELLNATPEENIKRRDLYDGAPLVSQGWNRGQVCICGDAAHPMMPNLGQGGCQATEDGYRLSKELESVKNTKEIEGALQTYFRKRIPRTTAIQIAAQLGSDLLVDFDKVRACDSLRPSQKYPVSNTILVADDDHTTRRAFLPLHDPGQHALHSQIPVHPRVLKQMLVL